MNHDTDCIICMLPTNIITLCCNKKLCNTCNERVTAMNPVTPLCPNCRRDLVIDDYITQNNALNLYDLRIHKRFIPIKPAKTITIQSIDDYGHIEIIETQRIPAEYDNEVIKYVSKNHKIQKALLSNENIFFARNKKHYKKFIFLVKQNCTKVFYKPILAEIYKNIPLKYFDYKNIQNLNDKIYYIKDTNIPLIPKSKEFIFAIGNEFFKNFHNKSTDYFYHNYSELLKMDDNNYKFKFILKYYFNRIREAQKLQARRIGFQKNQNAEIKAKEEKIVLKAIERKNTQRIIQDGEFPPKKNIKIGDIHITSTNDKGVCAGFNLWKYKSGKIVVFKNGKWIISEKVCKVDELSNRFKNILLKA